MVFSSPGVAGARPSNSSDASTAMCSCSMASISDVAVTVETTAGVTSAALISSAPGKLAVLGSLAHPTKIEVIDMARSNFGKDIGSHIL